MYKNYGRLNLLKLANEGVIDILKNKNKIYLIYLILINILPNHE